MEYFDGCTFKKLVATGNPVTNACNFLPHMLCRPSDSRYEREVTQVSIVYTITKILSSMSDKIFIGTLYAILNRLSIINSCCLRSYTI